MRKNLVTIVGLVLALSFVAAFADTTPPGITPPTPIQSVQPVNVTKFFTGKITKIDTKLSTISVLGDVQNKALETTTAVLIFAVNNQTIIKINRVKKAFKDLTVNMLVLVAYQVRNGVNVATAVTNPPPLPGQTP